MCTNPITLTHKGTTWCEAKSLQVPCGKCLECKIQYQNQIFIRLYEESKSHKHIVFFTLTYKPSSVPYFCDKDTGETFNTVYKFHIQSWLKRFRTRYSRTNSNLAKFKYFITSEYGPRTLRPHYHGVIFGLSKNDLAPLFNDWRKKCGFVHVRGLHPGNARYLQNVIRYVAKYCSKGEFENPRVDHGLVDKTFHLQSKKLGYGYIDRMRKWHLSAPFRRFDKHYNYNVNYLDAILDKRYYTLDGFRYNLPRYYKNKIYGEQSRLSYALSNRIFTNISSIRDLQLEQIQAQRNCTYIEADNILRFQEDEQHKHRYKQAKAKYEAFLNKSQL